MLVNVQGCVARHSPTMLPVQLLAPSAEHQVAAVGDMLIKRGSPSPWVCHIESGRVALGLMDGNVMEHQLGVAEGPCWLESTSAVLNLPHVVDAVAETEVMLRHVPVSEFRSDITNLPEAAQAVLHDVALAHRRQTEFAASRLGKDAEARCAEWLLSHAHPSAQGEMEVQLQQRKRSIAAQLGIAPETLSRVLRQLRERSLISGSGRTLSLVDPSGLRTLAGV
jgi:CRP-like cAMP-binding protein